MSLKEILEFIRGVVRPISALSLVWASVVLAFKGLIEPKEILFFTGLVMAFLFGERGTLKRNNGSPPSG